MKPLIPHFVEQQFRLGNRHGSFEAFTMFIDLTDFTPLTERMMQRGKDGAEQLSNLLNGIFSPLVNLAYQYGGFVPYFAGDAFTAIFPKKECSCSAQEFLQLAEMMRDLVRGLPPVESFRVGAKIGLSAGEVDWGIVGEGLKTFYFRGRAIQGSADAQSHAREQEIVLDAAIKNLLSDAIELQPFDNQPFYKLHKPTLVASLPEISVTLPPVSAETIREFLPTSVLESENSGEFRMVISLFISFDFPENYAAFNHFATIVLNNFSNYGGYFKEIDFSDKGSVMVGFFGAPVAFEDGEARALECMLALGDELRRFQTENPTLRFRIGATKGVAFTGNIGSEERSQYSVAGNAVNLAARIMSKAAWGEMLVHDALTDEPPFTFQHKGDLTLKGVAEPVPVFQLLGKDEDILNGHFDGELIGRWGELEQLQQFAKPLIQKRPSGVALVYGDAGVGKSRFIREVQKKLTEDGRLKWTKIQSDLILRKPFQPFLQFLKKYFQQSSTQPTEENARRFERKYQLLVDALGAAQQLDATNILRELARTKPVLATLIGLEYENSLWEHLDARGRYENTVAAIVALLTCEALLHPTVLEIEDAHSLDENSRAILHQLLRRMEYLPMMILAVARYKDDGTTPNLLDLTGAERVHVLELHLKNWTANEVRAFAEKWLGKSISKAFLEMLLRVTNGNPFYLEQVLQYFEENEMLAEENGVFSVPDSEVKVSDSLQSILMARIDKLSHLVRETVKTAAVIGREFEVPVLSEVLSHSDIESSVEVVKEQVKTAERVQILRAVNELRYIFQHSLLREAVYEMQLRSRLRQLHRLIAEAIEKIYVGDLDEHALELSYHYQHADLPQKALRYLDKAANHARSNFQNLLAIELYDQMLEFLHTANDEVEIIKTLLKKGSVHELVGQWEECATVLNEALIRVEKLENEQLLGRVRNDLGRLEMLRGNYPQARSLFENAAVNFENFGDRLGLSKTNGNLGNLFFRQGFYEQAKNYLQKSIEIGKAENVRADAQNAATLGLAHMNQGNFAEGIRQIQLELDEARGAGDKRAMATLLINLGIINIEKGDFAKAMGCLKEGLELSEALGNKLLISIAIGCIGGIFQEQGDYVRAMENFQKDLFLCEELGDKQGIAIAKGLIGELLSVRGKFEDAKRYLEQSLQLCESINYQKGIAKAVNNLADIHYLQENYRDANHFYQRAIELSRSINNKILLGKSLVENGMTLLELNRVEEARHQLSEALLLADELGNPDLLFQTKVLSAKVAVGMGDKTTAVQILEDLLKKPLPTARQASAYYHLYQVQPSENYRKIALNFYRLLFEKTPQFVFRSRIEELEGEY